MARSGSPSFLPDRFDEVDKDVTYVGTHRRERSSWSVFAPIGIGLGAVILLVLGGLWLVDRSDDNLALDPSEVPVITDEAPSEEPAIVEQEIPEEVVAITDPTQIDTEGLTLTVLNGTATQGMAARAVERLVTVGWPEATATNADSTDVQQSVVAYSEDADRAIALGVAEVLDLDADSVVQTTAYPGARITVVLGADYVDTEST